MLRPLKHALPCAICHKPLDNFGEGHVNQPLSGTEFMGGGVYGSAITDINYGRFILNICDDCLTILIRQKVVRCIDPNTGKKVKR